MIQPFQKNEQLITDIRASSHQMTGFRVWWLGQSGFLIQWQGKHLLFDPYLSDSLTHKYANTDKPHERISALVVAPPQLTMLNIVTSSHNHTDHLDADTLKPIFAANPYCRLVIPEANRAFVCQRIGCENDFPIGLNDAQSIEIDGFIFYGIPSAHNDLARDSEGRCLYMGYVVKFGHYAVYHSGDTLWYAGLETILQSFKIDIAFLPINGNKPERRVAGNLNYEEAARLGKVIGARLTIPHHYDLFAFNTENPALFEQKAKEYGTPYKILKLGEKLALV